jgi:dolichyl-phosphate-mannose-protein mannosyltransferase
VRFCFEKREITLVALLLLFAFLLRVALFPLEGYKNDSGTFAYWFNTAALHGPRVFYDVVYQEAGWIDYPPFNVYIFWVFGSLGNAVSSIFGSGLGVNLTKLPSNIFDMATAFLIFAFVRQRLDFKKSLLAVSVYVFNPAVIFNAAIWGQFDAIYTFFLLLSLILMFGSKPKWAVVSFMIGVLTKPQSIALAPLFLFLVLRKYSWKGLLTSAAVSVITIFAVIVPFQWSNPVTFLSKIYFGAYGGYAFTSVNAFNIWGFGGMWVPETQFSFLVGWVLFGTLAVFTLYFVHKRFEVDRELLVLFAAFVLFFGFFMLPTRIHERYLFPAFAVLALLFPFLKKVRPVYVVLTLTCLVNQAYVLSFLNANQFIQSSDFVVFTVSLINSVTFLYVLMLMIGQLKEKRWLTSNSEASCASSSKGGPD